jgi:hypothetical protein
MINVRKDSMTQNKNNQHRHTTRRGRTPVCVRARSTMTAVTIGVMAVLVAFQKEAAP